MFKILSRDAFWTSDNDWMSRHPKNRYFYISAIFGVRLCLNNSKGDFAQIEMSNYVKFNGHFKHLS